MATNLPAFYLQELNKLTEEQLRELHNHIWEKLKIINSARHLSAMTRFNIGERVFFTHDGQKITGTIIRLNQKTISVHADTHMDWKVSPRLLTKMSDR